MYGKWFSTVYEGSMVGAGALTFAVWGYCVAKADPESHIVSLNPTLLSAILGEPVSGIEKTIELLSSPDPKSRCPDHEGRRLLHQGGHDYLVVTHSRYRGMKSEEDRRRYMRQYMREYRASDGPVNKKVNRSLCKANPASASASVSDSGSSLEMGVQGEGWLAWSWDQAKATAEDPHVGMPESMARTYFDARTARGWVDGAGLPVARTLEALKADMRKWKVNEPNHGARHGRISADQRRADESAREYPENIKPKIIKV
jgi:hypothetical protein